jgi:hypothetical protein
VKYRGQQCRRPHFSNSKIGNSLEPPEKPCSITTGKKFDPQISTDFGGKVCAQKKAFDEGIVY